MNDQAKTPTPEQAAQMQAQMEAINQQLNMMSHHLVSLLAATGLDARAVAAVGSNLVSAGIEAIARDNKAVAQEIARRLAAGFIGVVNELGLNDGDGEGEADKDTV